MTPINTASLLLAVERVLVQALLLAFLTLATAIPEPYTKMEGIIGREEVWWKQIRPTSPGKQALITIVADTLEV
jgi:hypothetical protein